MHGRRSSRALDIPGALASRFPQSATAGGSARVGSTQVVLGRAGSAAGGEFAAEFLELLGGGTGPAVREVGGDFVALNALAQRQDVVERVSGRGQDPDGGAFVPANGRESPPLVAAKRTLPLCGGGCLLRGQG